MVRKKPVWLKSSENAIPVAVGPASGKASMSALDSAREGLGFFYNRLVSGATSLLFALVALGENVADRAWSILIRIRSWFSGNPLDRFRSNTSAGGFFSSGSSSGSDSDESAFEDLVYWGIVIASLIGIVVILGFIWFSQSTVSDSQAFTAIFFGDYNKSIDSGVANFSFTVENHENRDMNYVADLNVDNNHVAEIAFFLSRDRNFSQVISIPLAVSSSAPHKISVSLRDRSEAIHFWSSVKKEYPAVFGENNLAFISYSINPDPVASGYDFNITYTWKCLKPTDKDYTVFVHFVTSGGTIVFQNDHVPQRLDSNGLQSGYPTSKCRVGTTFSEAFTRTAPSPGDYSIRVGFYLRDGGRLPILDSPDNFFVIGNLKVQ